MTVCIPITTSGTGGGTISDITSTGTTITVTNPTGPTTNVDLPNTAVAAGSYTNTNLTVDAKGRLTAAASGSSGSGSYPPSTLNGGTITANPSVSAQSGKTLAVYILNANNLTIPTRAPTQIGDKMSFLIGQGTGGFAYSMGNPSSGTISGLSGMVGATSTGAGLFDLIDCWSPDGNNWEANYSLNVLTLDSLGGSPMQSAINTQTPANNATVTLATPTTVSNGGSGDEMQRIIVTNSYTITIANGPPAAGLRDTVQIETGTSTTVNLPAVSSTMIYMGASGPLSSAPTIGASQKWVFGRMCIDGNTWQWTSGVRSV